MLRGTRVSETLPLLLPLYTPTLHPQRLPLPLLMPMHGLKWDGANNSCAYDALLTILYNLLAEICLVWNNRFKCTNPKMKLATLLFGEVASGSISLENTRDDLHSLVHAQNKRAFLYKTRGTSVYTACRCFTSKVTRMKVEMLFVPCDCGQESNAGIAGTY